MRKAPRLQSLAMWTDSRWLSRQGPVYHGSLPERSTTFYTLPHGRLSGTPVASNGSDCIISSEIMGTIHLNTDYVNIIDFSQQNNLLDFWNDRF